MSVRAMRLAFVVFALTAVALIVAGYSLYRYAISYPDRPGELPGRAVELVIPKGAHFPAVLKRLQEGGLISSPVAFRVYANYKGQASKVRAGSYKLSTSITPRKLLDTLVHGVPAPTVSVTIPEGKQMLEVASLLAGAKITPLKELAAEMRNVHFLRRIGVPGDTIEGYLFPDTYRFRAHSPAQFVLEKLFRRHRSVYLRLRRAHTKGFAWLRNRLGWGQKEIVILASIVEKETGKPVERPLIARVFLNRLTYGYFQPKLLQTDPTIIYGCVVPEVKSRACERFKGRIRRIHLDDADNPYNTYKHAGLPPGPIANPGKAALQAVFKPAKARYLFFVSKNDGSHHFSKSRAEHERAVDKYQRRRRPKSGRPKTGAAVPRAAGHKKAE